MRLVRNCAWSLLSAQLFIFAHAYNLVASVRTKPPVRSNFGATFLTLRYCCYNCHVYPLLVFNGSNSTSTAH